MNPLTLIILAALFLWVRAEEQTSGNGGPSDGGGDPSFGEGLYPGPYSATEIVNYEGRDITANFGAPTRQWASLAAEAGRRFGVPPSIVLATIQHESSGQADAVGASGERGLMQITEPAVQDALEFTTLTQADIFAGDARANVLAGTAFLALQKTRWENAGDGSWANAVRAYICGFQGSQQSSCGATEATDRLITAGLV